MLSLVTLQGAFGVLDLKDAEVEVLPVQLFKQRRVNLVLELCDAEILYFDWVGNGPLQANRHWRQLVGVLQHLELSSAMKSFALKSQKQWLSVTDLEEHVQVVLHDLLGIVKYCTIDLLSRRQGSSLWLNQKDLFVENVRLESLFFRGLAGVSPLLHLNLRVVRHLKSPLCVDTPDVLKREHDLAGLASIPDRHFSKIPGKLLKTLHELFISSVGLV